MNLSVVLPAFNGSDGLISLVDSLCKLSPKGNFSLQIIIVDNASTDGSIQKLKKRHTHQPPRLNKKRPSKSHKVNIKIIENRKNEGFAKAANQGIKYSLDRKSDYILFLNQDVSLSENFIGFLKEPIADVSTPVISYKRNLKTYFDHGGKVNFFSGRTYHIEKEKIEKTHYQIDFVSACCMLVRSEVFKNVGLFDERFFLYFEDVDLCLRVKKKGHSLSVDTRHKVFHNLEEPQQRSLSKRKSLVKSNYLFIKKHIPFPAKFVAYLYVLFLYLKIVVLGQEEREIKSEA